MYKCVGFTSEYSCIDYRT